MVFSSFWIDKCLIVLGLGIAVHSTNLYGHGVDNSIERMSVQVSERPSERSSGEAEKTQNTM